MGATPNEPPYRVVGRPGPGLALITDHRDSTLRLWLCAAVRRGKRAPGATARRCANCGGPARGPVYRPLQSLVALADWLCVVCVEGKGERNQERSTL